MGPSRPPGQSIVLCRDPWQPREELKKSRDGLEQAQSLFQEPVPSHATAFVLQCNDHSVSRGCGDWGGDGCGGVVEAGYGRRELGRPELTDQLLGTFPKHLPLTIPASAEVVQLLPNICPTRDLLSELGQSLTELSTFRHS